MLFFIFFIFFCQNSKPYSLRQLSSKNGLSNSAILSISQDNNGFMWFGSCDGLNMFDGLNIRVYKPTNGKNNLSGNLIESIIEAGDDISWIQTNYGLDQFNKKKKTVITYKELKGKSKLATSPQGDVFAITEDNSIYYLKKGENNFIKYPLENSYLSTLKAVVDNNNILWIFTNDSDCKSYHIEKKGKEIELKPANLFEHDKKLSFCFNEGNSVYFVDESHILYEYDLLTRKKYYIYDLQDEISRNGEVSAIIKHHNDYYLGFKTNGLLHLKNIPDQKNNYSVNQIDIKSGIFCLTKDKFQDIIWVGTDGQGVYMYYIDAYSVKSTIFNTLNYPINKPVRSLFVDRENSLWIGTKGDGIVKIPDYDPGKDIKDSKKEHILSINSNLNDNSVFAFAKSNRNILWIGSDEGINYYSYKENRIKKIEITEEDSRIKYVHAICEANDSTLWIATVGEGIIKAHIGGTKDVPVITRTKRIVFNNGETSYNYFFTIYKENDSTIWFGNRGYGLFKMNTITDQYETFQFDKDYTNQTLNDIFSIAKNDKGYWFGTSFGLIRLSDGKEQVYNEANGFPNNTIHGILEDNNNNLWLSTNQGIIKFNTIEKTFQTYKQQNELDVIEFSDGAYYKDETSGTLYFGGVNGFITITKNDFTEKEYTPPIFFDNLSIFGKSYNISDFLIQEKDSEILELDYSQNFFSISFTAIDYINGSNYEYYYKLDQLSPDWIENGNSNTISFTSISPGQYTLYVKYKNRITGKESSVYSLTIKISPPWYRTNIAYLIYSIIVLSLIFLSIRLSLKWVKMRKDTIIAQLNEQQKEEIYESKLRFFTNITHELCTPLTLIYGPCEKIISHRNTDSHVRKYASLIQRNVEKLNTLIQELIEFRRLDSGNMPLEIKEIPMSETAINIADLFLEIAENKNIDYQMNIPPGIYWNCDLNSFVRIATNLLSNAFKYTPNNGLITIYLHIENETLIFSITNTGKGIGKDNLPNIFDRYKVLDDFEKRGQDGLFSRNGLGLAICHSLVKLLNGEIQVKSIPNETTQFKVFLPLLAANANDETISIEPPKLFIDIPITFEQKEYHHDKNKPSVVIVDDDTEMLWFISEIFEGKYNIVTLNSSESLLDYLKQDQPELIILDLVLPDIDGISLIKTIKSDKFLAHIPIIILSAKNDPEMQVKGVEAGAEMFITKPFNIEYLEKVVARFLQRDESLKEYYNSALSSFDLKDGRLIHKDDKALFEKIMKIIDENISNPDLSVEFLSSSLGVSTRHLYRKLKNITDKTPSDIIKEYRLKIVERLLVTSNMSIEEIIYKVGFNNRGNFFRMFSQKYGITPKSYREQRSGDVKARKITDK
ncbi:hybrid sensor histidine kinase/response regulator transcription factor [Dysgonomonas alginatilytica]|nr:hybrid sensor histidine kinase/response regulator transcription factor [Dysgonomonas alginatilytica]